MLPMGEEERAGNSFGRRVVNKLIASVRRVKESIDQGRLDEHIREHADTEESISANFLEALGEISICRRDSALTLSVRYAPTILGNRLEDVSVSIDHEYHAPMSALVDRIKGGEGMMRSFVGRVASLSAVADSDSREFGSVGFVFLNEQGDKVTASVELAKEDYAAAIEAHRDGRAVRVVGTMGGGRWPETIEYQLFEVLD